MIIKDKTHAYIVYLISKINDMIQAEIPDYPLANVGKVFKYNS